MSEQPPRRSEWADLMQKTKESNAWLGEVLGALRESVTSLYRRDRRAFVVLTTLTVALLATVVVLVVNRSGGPSGGVSTSGKAGCALATEAGSKADSLVQGIQDRTLTTNDVAGKLGSVAGEFDEAAAAADDPALADAAGQASTAAGRLRVDLVAGNDTTAAGDADDLSAALDDVAGLCL